MEQNREDRKEPEVEVNQESGEYSSSTGFQKPKRSFTLNKWALVPIFLVGITVLVLGLWMIYQSGFFSSKKQPETPELNALRTEVQNLKGEIASLKNEVQFL